MWPTLRLALHEPIMLLAYRLAVKHVDSATTALP
jgi:hypothetical protein